MEGTTRKVNDQPCKGDLGNRLFGPVRLQARPWETPSGAAPADGWLRWTPLVGGMADFISDGWVGGAGYLMVSDAFCYGTENT